MDHAKKVEWMAVWAARNKLQLELEGVCGFGRECVGVSANGSYADYQWYDGVSYDRLDKNGDVWCPKDAYHKHDCVAVLGRGEEAESQLYDWLKWFDDNGFHVEIGMKSAVTNSPIEFLFMGTHYVRMVKAHE